MTIAPREDRRLFGIGLMLLSFALLTGIDSCAKWLVLAGIPTMEVVFIRFAGHMLLVLAIAGPSLGRSLFVSADPKAEILRALCLLIGTVFNFIAVRHLPLTLTSTIFFTIPLWVCALSVPLLGEYVGWRRWSAILIGFVGVLVATRPWSIADLHWTVMFSIGAAFAAALYSILTRRLAGRDSPATQQIYAAGLSTVAIAPFARNVWAWPERGIDWLPFVLIGVFAWAGHQALTIAHRFAPATTLAPFIYVQLIYMTASSWLIFGQQPTIAIISGAAIVFASGLYIWSRERALAGSS